MPELEPDPESFDRNSRRLCPDGSCIGVIGPDGRFVDWYSSITAPGSGRFTKAVEKLMG